MLEEYKKKTELGMKKSYEACLNELSKIRTGRAHPGLLEGIKIDYYGNETPLKNVANINVSDARTLVIAPWDKNMVKVIDKAIRVADIGLNPVSEGEILRVPVPALTEERRKDLVRLVKGVIENCKVSLRNIRREVLEGIKGDLKSKIISEDILRRGEEEVQKITDRFVSEVDKTGTIKEQELMTV